MCEVLKGYAELISLSRYTQRSMVIHTKRQGTRLVTADVGDTSQTFESVKLADDDVFLGHLASSNGHGEGEDGDEGFRDDRNGGGDTIENDLVVDVEFGHSEHDDDEEHREAEKEVGEFRELDLKRSARLETHDVLDPLKDTSAEG